MNKRKKAIGTVFLFFALFLVSFFSFPLQNTLAEETHQDDENIEVTLHCRLDTNSGEIYSNLMPTGTYSFFDYPELDVGSFNHDLTDIDVSDIQLPTYNETIPAEYTKNDGLTGNFTVNSSKIEEYTLSAPFDTTIQANISFSKNVSVLSTLMNTYDIGVLGGNDIPVHLTSNGTNFFVTDQSDDIVYEYSSDFSTLIDSHDVSILSGGSNSIPWGLCWDGNHFFVVDNEDANIYEYTAGFSSYVGWYHLPSVGGAWNPSDITWDGNYFYVTDWNGYLYKYSSDFSTLIDSWHLVSGNLRGISFVENYFYIQISPYSGTRTYKKYSSDFSSILGSYNVGVLGGNDASMGITFDGTSFYTTDYAESVIYQYDYMNETLFNDVFVSNFTYKKLGVDYYENFTMVYDPTHSSFAGDESLGYVIYYFDSSSFSQYDYINDITIPEQNLSLIINFPHTNIEINMSIVVSYSSNEWKVPSEGSLEINGEEVIDSTYNSGYVFLPNYPSSLIISGSLDLYFKLNITCYFTFTLDLEIISKTYLRETFKLFSDHTIYIESIDFDDNLNLKKVYLNNIDIGSSDPTYLSPAKQMDQNNIFNLEIILSEELYRNLPYDDFRLIFSELFGSSTPYMTHSYYPDDHSALYTVANLLYMYNEYANSLINEDFTSWSLDSDSDYTDSSFSGGDLSSWLANGSNSKYPYFYNIESGYKNTDGTMLSADSDYATYLSQTEGIYGGEYNFADELIGTTGTDIRFVDYASTTTNTEIVDEVGGHKKVLNQTNSGSTDTFGHNFPSGYENANTREFWIRTEDTNKHTRIRFFEDSTSCFSFNIINNNFRWWDGSWHTITSASPNVWYHIKIIWISSNTYDLYINGVLELDDHPFEVNQINGINKIDFRVSDHTAYLDAFDRPEADGYTSGRNKEPIMYFGNYPGTYSFDDEEVWSKDTDIGWINSITGGDTNKKAEIILENDGHSKVMKLTSNGDGGEIAYFYHTSTGTIISDTYEFYIKYIDKGIGSVYFGLRKEDGYTVSQIKLNSVTNLLYMYYGDGAGGTTEISMSAINDTWYHVKMEFSSITDKCSIWIDNLLKVDNENFINDYDATHIKDVIFYHRYSNDGNTLESYVDAFGESNDPNYAIGDNYYYQYFQGSYPFEQYNLSTYANYYGTHDFEDYQETESNLGNYSAFFPFNNNTELDDFHIQLLDGNTATVKYNENPFGTLELDINNVDSHGNYIYNIFDDITTSGNIQTWIKLNRTDIDFRIEVRETNTKKMWIRFYGGNIYISDNLTSTNIGSFNANTWYFIEFDFNVDTLFYDVYINGILKADNFVIVSCSYINRFHFQFYNTLGEPSKVYSNGIDYNWVDNYIANRLASVYGLQTDLDSISDFLFYYRYNNSIKISNENSYHNNFLNLSINTNVGVGQGFYDYGYGGATNIRENGIIEFSFRIKDNQEQFDYIIYDSSWIIATQFRFCYNGKLQIYDTSWIDICSLNNNEWYNLKIIFETSDSGFHSLGNDKVQVFVNNTDYGVYDMRGLKDYENFRFRKYYFHTNIVQELNIDNLDYSWSPDYVESRSTNPYYEDLRDTGFLDDWDISYAYNCYVMVNGSYDAHKKYVELFDNITTNLIHYYDYFSTNQEYGTIEFWIKTTDATYQNYINLAGAYRFQIDADKFQYYDGSWNDVGLGATDNTWYHIRMDFECGTGGYDGLSADTWTLWIDGVEYGTYNFDNVKVSVGNIYFRTNEGDSNYHFSIDSLSHSWEDLIGTNLKCDQRMELNFTAPIRLTGWYDNDTVEALMLYYAYMTDIYQDIDFYIYNFITTNWVLINSSANNITFYSLNLDIFSNWANYVNATNDLLLKFYGYNNTNDFELYIDMLNAWYNWTKISGDIYAQISKNVTTAFLNRYDAFLDYLKLYNITLGFTYTFTTYQGAYSDYADITYNGTNTALTKDGSPHDFSITFEYDSTSSDEFNIKFNISNGLLELSAMSYIYVFKSLDSDNNVKMYQEFGLDCNLDLEDYQERYYDFILNFTISFNPADDYSDLTDDTDYSSLKYIINLTSENSNLYYNYTSNSSLTSQTISLNLRELLTNNIKYYLRNLNLHFWVAGNNSFIYLDNVQIYTENQYSIQKTINPTTEENSVEFEEYLEADRSFSYWYYYNTYEINDLEIEHESTSTNISTFEIESSKYYFSQSASQNDEFTATIDYKWNPVITYETMENNGTYTQLRIGYKADFVVYNVSLVLSLLNESIYNENWTLGADQSEYTYKLVISNMTFTSTIQYFYIEGVSSVPEIEIVDFINEGDFKISDEEWKIKIADNEWRIIKKSNWEDIDEYMYGSLNLSKYSKVFIVSNIEDDWELDGIHYQGVSYDITSVGYFECSGWGTGITTAYLRFKTNPIKDLEREQEREQVIYRIKSRFKLKDVDFIFYIEEDERYNTIEMIKRLKKGIDCTDIIKYYSVEDRDYYMIMNMDLDDGTNEIIIKYKIENAVEYAWAGIIMGIALIGFAIIYISYRYKDDKIIDFLGLDKVVKLFIWVKKPYRQKLLKKYRLSKKRKKR